MSKCVNCGNEITDGYNFCTNCGTKVGMVYNQQTGQDKILNPNSQSGNPIYAQYSYVQQQPCPVQFTGLVSCPGREIVGLLFGIGALIMGGLTVIYGLVIFLASIKNLKFYNTYSGYTYSGHMFLGKSSYFSLSTYPSVLVFSFLGFAFAIITILIFANVNSVAQIVSKKIKAGLGVAIAGLISSCIGLYLVISTLMVWVVLMSL